jgi:hypothetical protein
MCTPISPKGTPSTSEAICASEAAWPAPRSVMPLRSSRLPSASRPIQQLARSWNQTVRP